MGLLTEVYGGNMHTLKVRLKVPKISYYNIKYYDIILFYCYLTVFSISLFLFNSLFYSS